MRRLANKAGLIAGAAEVVAERLFRQRLFVVADDEGEINLDEGDIARLLSAPTQGLLAPIKAPEGTGRAQPWPVAAFEAQAWLLGWPRVASPSIETKIRHPTGNSRGTVSQSDRTIVPSFPEQGTGPSHFETTIACPRGELVGVFELQLARERFQRQPITRKVRGDARSCSLSVIQRLCDPL